MVCAIAGKFLHLRVFIVTALARTLAEMATSGNQIAYVRTEATKFPRCYYIEFAEYMFGKPMG